MARRDAGKGHNERPMDVDIETYHENHEKAFGKNSGPDRFKHCKKQKPESEMTEEELFRHKARKLAPPV